MNYSIYGVIFKCLDNFSSYFPANQEWTVQWLHNFILLINHLFSNNQQQANFIIAVSITLPVEPLESDGIGFL